MSKIILSFIFISFYLYSHPIKIKKIIETEKDEIYFSDVIDQLYEGNNFFIAYTPPIGIEKKISINYLKFKLLPHNLEPVLDSDFIVIKRKCKIINFSEIVSFIKEEINEKLKDLKGNIYVEVEKFGDILVPISENINFSLKWPRNSIEVSPLIVEIKDGDKKIKEFRVIVKIGIEGEFFITREKINLGETLEDKVIKKFVKVSFLRDFPILNEEDLKGKIAKVTIPSGSLLTANMIDSRPLVKKGDEIDINMENENLKIEMKLVSLQSGKKNEIIWAVNPNSGKRMKIKVTGEKQGEIIYGYDNL
ncbi:MAG: flagellar basal body P-ring formation chaperone FlgA [bacterium]|nr:flagellar basal body P-ring formation chaperone FlgA [bacterium]MDW8164328.1 flagellar basal body P-ring formation chaperone FlgA [Candidatus Omnitrophota bacterium]